MQLATQLALGCSVAGATILGALGIASHAPVGPVTHPAIIDQPVEVDLAPPIAVRASEDPTPVRELRYAFVIDLPDAAYVRLVDDVTKISHARPKLHHRDGVWSASAEVAPADLPDGVGMLAGRAMVVDGSCTATISGFAIVARLTGSTAYADLHDDDWTARTVFEHGEKQLVARLSGCKAKSDEAGNRWARDAALPAPIVGAAVALDAATVRDVKRTLFASAEAKAADKRWADPSWGAPDPAEKPWRDSVDVTTAAYTHAATGERWIVIRAFYGGACGMKTVDLSAIYRERNGTREVAWIGTGVDVVQLVDTDRDGAFELVTHGGFGDERDAIETLDGEAIDAVGVPFFGCPC